MKALVTGAAGFVGSHLSRRLVDLGHEVVGIDSISDYYDTQHKVGNLQRVKDQERFTFIEEDLGTMPLNPLLEDVDWVFHQAGQPGVRNSWGEDFGDYIQANIQVTQRLLEASRHSTTISRMIYASSSSVYGDAETYPTDETVLPRPRSPYGVTKLAAEHLWSLYGTQFNLPTVSLRYFTVYGPGQRPDMAFTRFSRAILSGQPIHVYGDGTQIRDFTYIDDVVEANILAAEHNLEPGLVMNVAGGGSITVNETLEILSEAAGRKPNIIYADKVAGDVKRTGGDGSLLRKLTGWEPKTSLRDGLEAQLRWAADPDYERVRL
ncbi:NAD-dependent epimerase/dehydratase family protein [Nesterenkonia ebinurensis]|uniref:NAD-dependent epimerase/dehydratase family protein n=1 Tax=Nesterenkonia ebinurensis TaxID=2608252 RepID=UPI00123CD7D6|nr:NAD-dependent epimerase/dehydratase family protein [Nesterenkonia ebinurensis]